MRYKGNTPDFFERLGDALITNLTLERVLTVVINIAIILAVVHYIVIPLTRGIGADLQPVDDQGQTVYQQLAAE